jgi:hypothetical protein
VEEEETTSDELELQRLLLLFSFFSIVSEETVWEDSRVVVHEGFVAKKSWL